MFIFMFIAFLPFLFFFLLSLSFFSPHFLLSYIYLSTFSSFFSSEKIIDVNLLSLQLVYKNQDHYFPALGNWLIKNSRTFLSYIYSVNQSIFPAVKYLIFLVSHFPISLSSPLSLSSSIHSTFFVHLSKRHFFYSNGAFFSSSIFYFILFYFILSYFILVRFFFHPSIFYLLIWRYYLFILRYIFNNTSKV